MGKIIDAVFEGTQTNFKLLHKIAPPQKKSPKRSIAGRQSYKVLVIVGLPGLAKPRDIRNRQDIRAGNKSDQCARPFGFGAVSEAMLGTQQKLKFLAWKLCKAFGLLLILILLPPPPRPPPSRPPAPTLTFVCSDHLLSLVLN